MNRINYERGPAEAPRMLRHWVGACIALGLGPDDTTDIVCQVMCGDDPCAPPREVVEGACRLIADGIFKAGRVDFS